MSEISDRMGTSPGPTNLGMGPDTFNKFSSNNYVNASNDFLESNSLVAKVAFLLLFLCSCATVKKNID